MGCHALLQGNLLNPGIEHRSLALQADSLPSETLDWLWHKNAMCVFSDLIIGNYKDFTGHVLQAKAAFPTLDLVHSSCISVSEESFQRIWGFGAVRFFTFSVAFFDSVPSAFHSCLVLQPPPQLRVLSRSTWGKGRQKLGFLAFSLFLIPNCSKWFKTELFPLLACCFSWLIQHLSARFFLAQLSWGPDSCKESVIVRRASAHTLCKHTYCKF